MKHKIFIINEFGRTFCPVSLRFWLVTMAHWVSHPCKVLLPSVHYPLCNYPHAGHQSGHHHSICSRKHIYNHLNMLIWQMVLMESSCWFAWYWNQKAFMEPLRTVFCSCGSRLIQSFCPSTLSITNTLKIFYTMGTWMITIVNMPFVMYLIIFLFFFPHPSCFYITKPMLFSLQYET